MQSIGALRPELWVRARVGRFPVRHQLGRVDRSWRNVDQPSTGGEPVFGVNGEDWAQGPSANVGFDVPASLTFAFHGPCIDIAQHVIIRNPDALHVIQGADQIQLTRTDGQALGLVNVFDAQGRVVYSTGTSQAECTIPTGSWPAGIFMLRVSSGTQTLVMKVTLP